MRPQCPAIATLTKVCVWEEPMSKKRWMAAVISEAKTQPEAVTRALPFTRQARQVAREALVVKAPRTSIKRG